MTGSIGDNRGLTVAALQAIGAATARERFFNNIETAGRRPSPYLAGLFSSANSTTSSMDLT